MVLKLHKTTKIYAVEEGLAKDTATRLLRAQFLIQDLSYPIIVRADKRYGSLAFIKPGKIKGLLLQLEKSTPTAGYLRASL